MTTDVFTFGEALVAIRSHGRLSQGDPMSASLAGAETNVAIGLTRLGHQATWAGVLGNDPAGDLILRTLRAEGVCTSSVRQVSTSPTAVMLVDMPASLPPTVTYYRENSAGSKLCRSDTNPTASHRLLHFTGITPAISQTAREATYAAVSSAKDNGTRISFDVNYRSKLWDQQSATAALTPLARLADIIIASENELNLIATDANEPAQIKILLRNGAREVIVKRGRNGADHFDRSGKTTCPAHPINEVNSIGAGDAFTAGYLSGVLDGLPVVDRLQRGAFCGALAVSGVGDWEQAPTRSELQLISNEKDDAIR